MSCKPTRVGGYNSGGNKSTTSNKTYANRVSSNQPMSNNNAGAAKVTIRFSNRSR